MTGRPGVMRQRAGKVRKVVPPLEPARPAGVGGAAPRKPTSTSSPNASTRRWRRTRAAKLEANPACELQLPGCEGAAVEVDHSKQLADGGERFEWANLRSACGACHDRRHGKRRRRSYSTAVDDAGEPLDPRHPCYWPKDKWLR